MTRIYLVRHAESVANTRGIYQGQTYDTPLSPLGRLQAKALADHLQDQIFDRIIVSPLVRTMQTAQLIAQNQNLTPYLDRRVIETNHGQWEGQSKSEIARRWPQIYLSWQNFPSRTAFPGGERFVETHMRIISWWEEVNHMPGNTLVVTHDNIIRIILARLCGLDLDRIWEFNLQPASVTLVENNEIKVINHTSHVTDLLADLSLHAL